MLTSKRVLGVNGRSVTLDHTPHSRTLASSGYNGSRPTSITASLSALGGSGAGTSVNGFWQSAYQYYMTGIIPADPLLIDTSTLALFYRDIYLFDNVGGSCVDIQAHFPYSSYELRGLEEKELEYFQDALAQLKFQTLMPLIATANMVDGFFAASLVFNQQKKTFIDTLIHDALSCAVIPAPFFNVDPTINVRVAQATQQFMHDTSSYAKQYLQSMPSQFLEMLRSGAFTLDPVTTWFIPRRSTTDRAYTSYLHRLLPMYLIEKTLFRGTLVEAQRRQRALTHLTAGDDQWVPSGEELEELVRTFQTAEYDPLGGWVSTRASVQASDIRPGGDFWKWTDMSDVLVPYKLRALGVSESFLSGDATYASAESAYSTFLETQNSNREDLTERTVYSKLFPLIAVVNGLYKDPSKDKVQPNRILDFLFNQKARANLKMPQLHWHKELEAKGEENMGELLEHASEKGVPIPLKMWMAASKIDPEALLRDLAEDAELRKRLEKYTGKDTSHEGEGSNEFSDDEDRTDYSEDRGTVDREYASLRDRAQIRGKLTTQSLHKILDNPRVPLLARDFGDSGDSWKLTKTGNIKYVPSAARTYKRNQTNDMILKIARQVDKDPHYRETLKRKNQEKLGRTTVKKIFE